MMTGYLRRRGVRGILSILLLSVLLLSLTAEAFAEIRVDAQFFPETKDNVSAEIFLTDTAMWVTAPDGKTYLLLWDDVPGIVSELAGIEEGSFDASEIDEKILGELAERYGKIIISVVGLFNLSRKKTEIELSAFGISQHCTVWSCTPSRRSWGKMLTKLFNTAEKDEQLVALLPDGGLDLIRAGQQNVDVIADELDGLSIRVAYEDGNLYAVELDRKGQIVCYQCYGSISEGRKDAIVVGSGEEEIIFVRADTTAVIAELPKDAHRIGTSEDIFALFSEIIPAGGLTK